MWPKDERRRLKAEQDLDAKIVEESTPRRLFPIESSFNLTQSNVGARERARKARLASRRDREAKLAVILPWILGSSH
jgi:hypothetical protein